MSLRVSHTTINATDAYALSVFWAAALGQSNGPWQAITVVEAL